MKKILATLFCLATILSTNANEGMWLPFLLENNIGEMSEMGLHLTADDIYSINQECLNNAVVGFIDLGSPFSHFCTGSVISAQGLVITNHHCGLSVVQQHSTLQHDYITNGFWATQQSDELGGNDIGVCFLRRMEDVTDKVLEGISDTLTQMRRRQLIESNISKIESSATEGTNLKAKVDAFYCDNEYYLSVYEIFEDVRLVGTPPISVGKFGGDTDNWVWPRHTGDFTLSRIYADSANQPAKYSESNVPYKASSFLKINAKQKTEGDFAMLMGYPGTTREYLPSFAVDATQNIFNPIVINNRGESISIIKEKMRNSQDVMIKYTSKVASLSNTWKKMQGECLGLRNKHVVEQKKLQEHKMQLWIDGNDSLRSIYGDLLARYESEYNTYVKVEKSRLYIAETLLKSEIIDMARDILITLNGNDSDSIKIADILDYLEVFFDDYDIETDKTVTEMLISQYLISADNKHIPNSLKGKEAKTANFADDIYSHSFLTNKDLAIKFFKTYSNKSRKKLDNDPLFKLATETSAIYKDIAKSKESISNYISELQRKFMQMQRLYLTDKNFFPDANSTLRIAYGQIKGFKPNDAVYYEPFTNTDGILQKCDMDIYDYEAPEQLKQIYKEHDFGDYCNADSTMPVCFLTTCHTTGGNSGSPILDADGYLIGLNFDRVWEGTMSDLQFNADICRNIGLDIRFALFFIQKYAKAQHIIDEMVIIE